MSETIYDSLGASASKAGLHQALDKAGISSHSGLFASVNDDLAGDPEFKSFVHCDGAGTKSLVAYLHFRENGDPSIFAGLAQDALVMNLDDIFCLGTPQSLCLANAIARNARLISDEIVAALISRYAEMTKELQSFGIPISLSGGETADCGDIVRTLVVDAVVTGRIKSSDIINTNNVKVGDVIVGLASYGKASYEKKFNSGIGSNGLTLARHALLNKHHREVIDTCDPQGDPILTYQGPYGVNDNPKDLGLTIGEALLSPTRTFAPVLKKIYDSHLKDIHAAIHVTGGGLTKVLRFGGESKLFVKDNLHDTPVLFQLIQQHGKVGWREMYQVFNMGQRMELYVDQSIADSIIKTSESFNIAAKVIGRVEAGDKSQGSANKVLVKTEHGEFDYSL